MEVEVLKFREKAGPNLGLFYGRNPSFFVAFFWFPLKPKKFGVFFWS